jgi:hypothetical protein
MKQRDTIKLFYGKYAYKIVIRNDLTSIFGSYNRKDYAKNTLAKMGEDLARGRDLTIKKWRGEVKVSVTEFERAKKIYTALQAYLDNRVRAESSYSLTIYTNEVKLVDNLVKNIGHSVREVYRPREGVEEFLNTNIETAIIKTEMPYEFRVYFNGNRVDTSFANWLKANTDKSRVGTITLRNIENGFYTGGNYFYIKNEKILTMIRMLVGHNIRKVERLVYIEDIDK